METQNLEHSARKAMESGNYTEARRLLMELGERGSSYALQALAWIHEVGAVGKIDKHAACEYYLKSGSKGSDEAYYRLGILLQEQDRVVEAQEAFGNGAQMGNLSCMYELAIILRSERASVSDEETGRAWLNKAAREGHIPSKRLLYALDYRAAKTVGEKLKVVSGIILLTAEAFVTYLRGRDSKKL